MGDYHNELAALPVFPAGRRNFFLVETKQLFASFLRKYDSQPHVFRDVARQCNASDSSLRDWVKQCACDVSAWRDLHCRVPVQRHNLVLPPPQIRATASALEGINNGMAAHLSHHWQVCNVVVDAALRLVYMYTMR